MPRNKKEYSAVDIRNLLNYISMAARNTPGGGGFGAVYDRPAGGASYIPNLPKVRLLNQLIGIGQIFKDGGNYPGEFPQAFEQPKEAAYYPVRGRADVRY